VSAEFFAREFDQLETGGSFVTQGRTITEADLVSFAALTGDWHPQHGDATWAANSRFGSRVAHGMLVLSYAVGLVPIDPSRVIALRSIDDVVFKRPVRIGDTVHVEGRVAELRALDPELGLVAFVWKILNQDGEAAVRARVSVLWRRGEGHQAEAEEESSPREVFL
jgi:3-hydroxybutyryl-CoA dehydratase